MSSVAEMLDMNKPDVPRPSLMDNRRNAFGETVVTTIVALLVLVLFYAFLNEPPNIFMASIGLAGLVTVAYTTLRSSLSPDRLRAKQTDKSLSLASQTLVYMRSGLSAQSCQEVCNILLPETQAMAVAMTDDKVVLGFAGAYAPFFPIGSDIHTEITRHVLRTQQLEGFTSAEVIGPDNSFIIPAGIVAPLVVRGRAVGTLKFYYSAPYLIDKTQEAIAEGFAQLLSTQLYIAELDRQVELATKSELQALQAQINPHFLFNTLNTISSLIRTDPQKARDLLRDFAVFYRQTLENSDDLITLEREVEQTLRYFSLAQARFGTERIQCKVDIGVLDDLRVPSFIIQPVVENAVNHAMPDEGVLHIDIEARESDDDIVITIEDDGVGMTDEQQKKLALGTHTSDSGTGIALANVDSRLQTVFGHGSGLTIFSRPGAGTKVTLLLVGANKDNDE